MDEKRNLFPTLCKQRRMHSDIFSWSNKFFYKNEIIPLAKQNRKTKFKPYTVFQVNTIEDVEIAFLKRLLELCFTEARHNDCKYGIICGDPNSQAPIEAMLKYVVCMCAMLLLS